MRADEVAGVVSLLATASALGALAYLHVAPTGLSPVRAAVSQYGISPYRSWYRALTVSMGAAAAALAVALATGRTVPGTTTLVGLVGAFAACRLAISWFPMDAPGAPRTSTGTAHGLLALVTFVSVTVAAVRLGRVLDAQVALHPVAVASRLLGWGMAACVALLFLARLGPDLRRRFGVIERALYALILAWLVVVGLACATGRLA